MERQRHSAGFSLIEVMIVLVIIGIATAAISVSVIPNPADTLRLDARELAQRLSAAQSEVRVDGRVIAWQATDRGYRFSRGVWLEREGSPVPVLSTAGALDNFSQDEVLRPRLWRAGEVNVTPGGPLLLTSEWISKPLRLELHSARATVTLERDASGAFVVP